MKNYIIVLILLSLFSNINAQQSNLGKVRPNNVSKGIIYKGLNDNQIIVNNVPIYLWHRGCGPTALGMVVGYYDMNGFNDLIIGNASSQTTDVNNAMANQEHYDDYSLPIDNYPDLFQDKSELGGAHSSNCIADFMETSWSSKNNRYGWSWSNKIDDAFRNYIQMQNANYTIFTSYNYFGSSSWDNFKIEIDNNRPVVILVDSDGDGNTDHFVTGIGYDEDNSTYGIYDTWDNDIHWYGWRGLASGNDWGIYGFNILQVTNPISVSSQTKDKFKIYPIPAKDIINIEFSSNKIYKNISISLYNNFGKEVLYKDISTKQNKIILNISEIKSGNYILKITNNNKSISMKKLVVLR